MLESRYRGGAAVITPVTVTVTAFDAWAGKDPAQRSAVGGAP